MALAPEGCLFNGQSGTGKTLLVKENFLKVVSSTILYKYLGESARLISVKCLVVGDGCHCVCV